MSRMHSPGAEAEGPLGALQLVNRFFQCLDDGRTEEASALFAEDGAWVRRGERIAGRAAVLAALQARPANLMTRHLVTNAVIEPADGGASVRYYATVFAHEGEAEGPAPLRPAHSILVCEDWLVWADGWRFALRTSKVAFLRPQ